MTLFFQPGSTRDQLVSGVSILKPDRLKQVAAAESIKKKTLDLRKVLKQVDSYWKQVWNNLS